jgi:ActR/RegA family two-component response regulator
MNNQQTRILLVEDDKGHAELVCRAFEPLTAEFELTVAVTLADARARLEQTTFDLVISDLRLPDGKGTALLSGDGDPRATPQVVVTSAGNEQEAVEAMKAGAMDYVVKSAENFADMPHLARRTLSEWRNRLEQKRVEKRLRMLSLVVEQSTEGIAVGDTSGNLLFVNEPWASGVRIVVLYDPRSERSKNALATAQRFARAEELELIIAVRAQTSIRLEEAPGRLVALANWNEDTIVDLCEAEDARLLVVPPLQNLDWRELLLGLADRLRCSLLRLD